MKTAAILVIDDEPDLLENIKLTLEIEDDYQVVTAMDGLEGLRILKSQPVDLIIADIAMPEMNGYQLYERVSQHPQWRFIPFIFLTARKLASDVRYGKELGVDDYLTKPIAAADLLAVVRGKLRRAQQRFQVDVQSILAEEIERNALVIGALKIDPDRHQVWLNEQEVKLSAREFTLLEHLARQVDKVVSHQELIRITHDLETDHIEASALSRSLVHSVRRKLGDYIENVRGIGYRLITPNN